MAFPVRAMGFVERTPICQNSRGLMTKGVLLLGAGATVADVVTRPVKSRPPLDKGFFAGARKSHSALVRTVSSYLDRTYAIDLTLGEEDSLELVMSRLFTDSFNEALAGPRSQH